MDSNYTKKLVPLAVLVVCLAFINISLVVGLRKEIDDETSYRKFLVEQQSQLAAEKKTYLTGRFDPAERSDFAPVPREYTTLPHRMYLRKETLAAFIRMREVAALDGIELKIASAARNFDYQKDIWNRKWTGETLVEGQNLALTMPSGPERFKKILEYSAAPGTSRHHWGTDIDIYYAIPSFFESGQGRHIYDWLSAHAAEFGFCQTYDAKDAERATGYNEEKWHWSYLPLARGFTKEYKNLITEKDLHGFLGDEHVPELNLIEDYVLGINPECI